MSSRIRNEEAGPGANPPPAETPDAQPSPPEPQERREQVSAPIPPSDPEQPTDTPAEGGAEGTERQPSESERDYQRRIDQLTRDKYNAQRERDQIRNEWQAFQEQQRRAQQPPPSSDYERGRREAYEERVNQDFTQACNTLFAKGVQEYGDEMGEARDRLNAVGWGNRPDALAAVTQLPDGHRVYRELARDLDNAARVLTLPPMAMAMELARMAGRETSPANVSRETMDNGAGLPPVSRAPEPTRSIGGNSRAPDRPLDHPQVSMAEFIRRRDREERRSRISR